MPYTQPYIDNSGLHIPTYDQVLQDLIERYKQIFGADVYLGQDTQDYQLLSLYARSWDNLASVMIDSYNARNINWATGAQLDTLVALNGIRRLPATYSTVTLNVSGRPNTQLQAGVSARDTNGYSWKTVQSCQFDSDGSATVMAQCTQPGAINAQAGTITTCQTPTYNWLGVTNDAAAAPGRQVETDAQLRQRRALTLSDSSTSGLDSIVGQVRNTSGVQSVVVIENNTSQTDDNGIPAHSICVVVRGGTNSNVAKAIFESRAPGIGTHGTTQVTHKDAWGHDNIVKFSRPSTKNVSIVVNLTKLDGFDDTQLSEIKTNIRSYVQGLPIGQDLSVPYLYAQAYLANAGSSPSFAVTSITANSRNTTVQADYDSQFAVSSLVVNVT